MEQPETNRRDQFELARLKQFDDLLEQGKFVELRTALQAYEDRAAVELRGYGYGAAVHLNHTYRGLMALAEGDPQRAKLELVKSGAVVRSLLLGVVGPNMRLAKALMQRGERSAVVEFIDRLGKIWYLPFRLPKVRRWKAAIARGETPDFGRQL